MEKNNHILDELKEISPAVANLNRRNVYSVPSGYFSGLADHILNQVKAGNTEIIPGKSANPFSIPEGYFDTLSSQILSKVKQPVEESEVKRELAEVAPFLNTINKQDVYKVPAAYFESVKPNIRHQAPIKSMRGFSKFARYAAAAVITGILALGGIFFLNDDAPVTTASSFNKAAIKQLTEQEIIEYLEANSTTGTTKNEPDASLIIQTQQLSEEEIIQYLNENPEPGDAFQLEG